MIACKHGKLKRQCEVCELTEVVGELRNELSILCLLSQMSIEDITEEEQAIIDKARGALETTKEYTNE